MPIGEIGEGSSERQFARLLDFYEIAWEDEPTSFDIDFDKDNNLWFVTGDDTPAGGGNSGGFSPHNDQKTSETQTVRVNGATGGTFTLTFNGQTTAPIPFDATAAQTRAALEALSNIGDNDIGVAMWDPATGGGYDGLTLHGPNRNQGAESTLALLSTLQQARSTALQGRRTTRRSMRSVG